MLLFPELHGSPTNRWSQFANRNLPEEFADFLFFFGRERRPGEQLHFRDHRHAVASSGKWLGQLAAEKIERDVRVEQAGHSHSPRTRCCHASGSSGRRSTPANCAKSLARFDPDSPFTSDARNSSSFFFCSNGKASAAASISASVLITLRN